MDPLSMFLYFGLPSMIGSIGWVAVILHERSAPPEAVGDNSDEEYVPAFVRKSDIREATDRRRMVAPWSNTAVPMLTLRKAAGHTAEDLTPEYVRWFRETYGQTADPFARNLTEDETAAFVRWIFARQGRGPASTAQPENGPGWD